MILDELKTLTEKRLLQFVFCTLGISVVSFVIFIFGQLSFFFVTGATICLFLSSLYYYCKIHEVVS